MVDTVMVKKLEANVESLPGSSDFTPLQVEKYVKAVDSPPNASAVSTGTV